MQVPEIQHPLCSKRVLTMEFVTGANVCDKAALARMGLKASDVARLVSETFNEMIFIFGDVSSTVVPAPQCAASLHDWSFGDPIFTASITAADASNSGCT